MKLHLNKKKTIILITCILLLIFAVMNGLWFYYRYTYFTKLIQEHPEFEEEHSFDSEIQSPLYKEYTFRDSKPHGDDVYYRYSVNFPMRYLRFSGNYAMAQSLIVDTENDNQYTNQYAIIIRIKPFLSGKYRYDLQITDYTDCKKLYHMEVNSDAALIQDYQGDAEIILDKADAEIREAMDSVNSVFGLS